MLFPKSVEQSNIEAFVNNIIEADDKELLEMFFQYGGSVDKEGFLIPEVEPEYYYLFLPLIALIVLNSRNSGSEELVKIEESFLNGKVDESGKPIVNLFKFKWRNNF